MMTIHSNFFSLVPPQKIFTVAALYNAYGIDYRFKTPVYAKGSIENGILEGDLILVGQGDLTLGGRQDPGSETIAFTKMDHIYANMIPGATLTPQDPLNGLKQLAEAIAKKGIKTIDGDVLIDGSLFEQTEKRGMQITPVILNDNLIDLFLEPTQAGQLAKLTWRPMVEGYTVKNEVKTVEDWEELTLNISSDASGKNIVIEGSLPVNQKQILRTFSINDPKAFTRAAFIQALKNAGITFKRKVEELPIPLSTLSYVGMEPIAVLTSPPLSEYGKLILKVSHNLGANLVPLLLAVKEGDKSFDAGMVELGKFAIDQVKVSENSFVFIDGAGGDENRLTPRAEVQLLKYVRKLPPEQFKAFDLALPILGVDGSLADVSKSSPAAGKVRAKPGTGIAYNLALRQYFLTTQAFVGYIEGKNGHLIEFMIAVNNGTMPQISDIFRIFDDFGAISTIIYENSGGDQL